MIESLLNDITLLSSNSSPITFSQDTRRTRSACGCNSWLCHSEGSPIYKLIKGGDYRISFNANVTSTATGIVALGLFADGILIPGTTMIANITTAGDYINVSFDKVIPICCNSNASITIGSVSSVLSGTTPASTVTQVPTIQNANLIIERLC